MSITDLGVDAAVTKCPGLTGVLTHSTHDGGVGFTDLFTDETTEQEQTQQSTMSVLFNHKLFTDFNTRDLQWFVGCLN